MEEKVSNQNHLALFPKEIIEQTTHHHFWRHSVRSQVLYVSVFLTLVLALAALPFLYVDISVKSRGIIRPLSERKALVSPVSGRLARLEIRENDTISKGMLVAQVESPLLEKRLVYNRRRQEDVERYVSDLTLLLELDSTRVFNWHPSLKSAVFKRSRTAFQQELRNSAVEVRNARRLRQRQQYLFEKEALPHTELEESEYTFNLALSRYHVLFDRQMKEWEAELIRYKQELDELKAEELQVLEERRQYDIYMPVNGTIQNLSGISMGSYIQVNQQLAEISPDTGLVAECYVAPRDIGLIKEGMEVRFQVDSFDYNRWGTLRGSVTSISNDAVMNGDQPFFRVRSVLDRSWLEVPNGYRGHLKKGMTLQARFRITERSLFQLLYDNVDDWLNPAWSNGEEITQVR